jgi:hypothetical protein
MGKRVRNSRNATGTRKHKGLDIPSKGAAENHRGTGKALRIDSEYFQDSTGQIPPDAIFENTMQTVTQLLDTLQELEFNKDVDFNLAIAHQALVYVCASTLIVNGVPVANVHDLIDYPLHNSTPVNVQHQTLQ